MNWPGLALFIAGVLAGAIPVLAGALLYRRYYSPRRGERHLLKTLIESLPDFIYVKDREGRFLLLNSCLAHTMGGKSADEFIGKTDYDVFPRHLAEEFRRDELRIMETGVPMHAKEEPCADAEGNPTWLLTTKVPLYDTAGRISGIIGLGRNILRPEEDYRRAEIGQSSG